MIRDFIRDVGGPDTISAFKKKYPWAEAVFQQARTECIKNALPHQQKVSVDLPSLFPKT